MDEAFFTRRSERTKVELLNSNDVSLGILGRALGGSIDYNQGREIRGGGSMEITLAQDVAWESARIKISRGLVKDDGSVLWFGCGVFRPLVGDESWGAAGATQSVQLLDKTSYLKEALVDQTFSVGVNDLPTTQIRQLLDSVGEARYAITPSAKTLSAPMSWPAGTSILEIINALCDAIGYWSIWMDGEGIFQVQPYVRPSQRPVVFNFRNDKRSIVTPEFLIQKAPYLVPNKIIATSTPEGDNPVLVAVATNTDPDSPYSYQARGNRWLAEKLEDQDVTDQATLDTLASRALTEATSAARSVEFTHGWIPLAINDVVGWYNSRAGLDIFGVIVEWKIDLLAGTLMTSKVTEVTTV